MPTTLKNTSQSISGGRVTTLELDTDKPVAAVEILSGPAHGHATVNPDNSIALVLSGSSYAGPDELRYRITYADGSKETNTGSWTAKAPVQEAGWGQGKHYMLAEDTNGDVIVETGDVHRKVHVSESAAALSLADIAAREGLAASAITQNWLIANETYGATEDMALDTEAGMALWRGLTSPHLNQPVSHTLLFERDHTYDPGRLITAKLDGESPLHPVHITAWGEGERPVITSRQDIHPYDSINIVFSDLAFTDGILSLTGENIIFDDVLFTDEGLNIQHGVGYTLHDSEVTHVVNDPPAGADYWSGTKAGLFTTDVTGWLIEGTIFHHNGWEDDYRADWSTEGGMPPNRFSHNVYLQNTTKDVTLRNNIIAEGSSFGAHIRGGGYVENNLFLDNNNAVDLLGGAYGGDGAIGNFTFFANNVITSGAHKETDRFDGGVTRGVTNAAYETTLLDNIVAHLVDPNNPDDAIGKWRTNYALYNDEDAFFDNTLIYNWIGNDPARQEFARGYIDDRNVGNVTPALADQTTIQNFAADLMGTQTGTIRGLMDYLVAQGDTARDDAVTAADIVAYFQAGFGFDATGGTGRASHRFVPDELGDGVRWENRINWDSEQVPDAGDSVDLAGNRVQYGGTSTLADLDLGAGGRLSVNYGRLTVTGTLEAGTSGARLGVERAGQFWTDGYADTDRITFDIAGGRFANTGAFTGLATIAVGGQAQAILATDGGQMVLGSGSALSVSGSRVKAGFDGDGTGAARLDMQNGATLRFVADTAGVSTIGEFRSGHWDQKGSPVQSAVRVDGRLEIDLSSYGAGPGTMTLIDADRLEGRFDDIDVTGLSASLDAALNFNSGTDRLTLDLSPGSGKVSYSVDSNSVDPGNGQPEEPEQQAQDDPEPPEEPEQDDQQVADKAPEPAPDPADPPQGSDTDYRITVLDDPDYSAGYSNVVGVYTLDDTGEVHDPRILVDNAKTQRGESFLVDVDPGHSLHFFLIQNAAAEVAALAAADELSLEIGTKGYDLQVNGADVDWTVFYSEAASRNPDGMEHFRYGPEDDTGTRVLGMEDVLWGGDMDYSDVGLVIQQLQTM